MNKPTTTPRTDAATYPADCLGQTLVTNRDCPCALERELTAITAERDQLFRDYEYDHKCLHEVRERCESWKQRAEKAEADAAAYLKRAESFSKLADEAEAELAKAKERLRSEAMDDYAAIKDLQRELAELKEGAK